MELKQTKKKRAGKLEAEGTQSESKGRRKKMVKRNSFCVSHVLLPFDPCSSTSGENPNDPNWVWEVGQCYQFLVPRSFNKNR